MAFLAILLHFIDCNLTDTEIKLIRELPRSYYYCQNSFHIEKSES